MSGVTMGGAIQFFGRSAGGEYTYFHGQASSEAEAVSRQTAYAAAAYCYVAMDYRARMASQPALMVVEETEDGEEWIPGHALADFLDAPSPDLDMGELLHLKSLYVDMTGSALFVKDRDNASRTGALRPFSGEEFTVEPADGRIFGKFTLHTNRGAVIKRPDEVVFFRSANPGNWSAGLSKVDVCLAHLNLSQAVRATAKALLANAVFPSVIIQTHPEWQPTTEEFARFKSMLDQHAATAGKGKPLALTGGGTATRVSFDMADLLPAELMDRVEATVAAVFGIPAVILQFLVGLKNSPWSQMEQARRMAYDDTIEGIWQRDEKVLTRQLLRDTDTDPTHFIRFDRSRVPALQADLAKDALIVASVARDWSLNERRVFLGKPKLDDPRADEIPALTQPSMAELFGGARTGQQADDTDDDENLEPADDEKQTKARNNLTHALVEQYTQSLADLYTLAAGMLFERDRTEVTRIVERALGGTAKAEDADRPDASRVKRAQDEAATYLATRSRAEWDATMRPLLQSGARRAVELLHSGLNMDLQLLNQDVLEYANREAAWLIKEVSNTSKDAVRAAIRDAFTEGEDHRGIAKRIVDLPAFDRQRAILVARTESTRVSNGAPREALSSYAERSGKSFVKTWSAVLDERTRDEHAEMDGETVDIDADFSNGEQSPGSPNCRCVLLYSAAEDVGKAAPRRAVAPPSDIAQLAAAVAAMAAKEAPAPVVNVTAGDVHVAPPAITVESPTIHIEAAQNGRKSATITRPDGSVSVIELSEA